MIVEVLVSALLVAGGAITLIGSIGLVRLPDVFMRLHAPTKSTTLGVGSVMLGSLVYFTAYGTRVSVHELLLVVFLFTTAPVSAHLIARAAMHRRCASLAPLPGVNRDRQTGD